MMAQSVSVMRFLKLMIAAIILFGFASPTNLSAQVVGATVSGRVLDPTGAVIPAASISVENVATGISANGVTNAEGYYVIPNLQTGTYDLKASAKAFATQISKGIILTVGEELVLNLTLTVGSASQSVTVTSEAPTVDLANSTLSGVSDSKAITELPLNGRSWSGLAALQPGVNIARDQPPLNAGDRVDRGLGQQMNITGGRSNQNDYLLDGVNFGDHSNNGPGSILGGNLGVDSVAEFTVLTTNYSAEYGRTSGGVISAVTKSGTNKFHGDAYEFLRNSALDARNYFDPPKIPAFRQNQFGASVGGPIQKDKTFIFGNYEGIRQNLGMTAIDNVPSPAARAGNLSTGSVPVDPTAAKFLQAFYPSPNGPISGDTGTYQFTNPLISAENFFIIRADHNFSVKDRISGTYLFDNTKQASDDEFKNKVLNNLTRRQVIAMEWNHTFNSQLLNSSRFGFNRENLGDPLNATAINPATADTSLGFVPGESAGQLNIGPLTGFSGGLSAVPPNTQRWNSWQGYDNLFYSKGIHSLKVGVNLEKIQYNSLSLRQAGGVYNFNSLSDFLTNTPASFQTDTPGTESARHQRQTVFGTYIQDDIHVRSNLTFNLGLRYEMASIITETNGKISNLRVLNSSPPNPFLGSPYVQNPSKWNFEPRVGVAWDPFKNGKTAVRAGVGLYDHLPLLASLTTGVDSSFPFAAVSSSGTLPVGSFPTEAFSSVSSTHTYSIVQFNPKRNYIAQWNLNIQRQIASNTTAMVAYVGARGVHMWNQYQDVNMVLPTSLISSDPNFNYANLVYTGPRQDLVWPTRGTGTPINPLTGRVNLALWNGNYYYNAFEAQINKTLSHGFQIEGSYTFAKNIDNGSGGTAPDQYRNSISTPLWFCTQCTHALADTNIKNALSVNYNWNIPTPAFFPVPARAILGNWQTGGILTMQSGTPFTVLVSGDPLGQGSTDPYQYPDRLNGPGCKTAVNPGNVNEYIKLQCFTTPSPSNRLGDSGRNSLIGPGLMAFDLSLFKNIPIARISESFRAQFRIEMFNALNHSNFTSPNANRTILNPDGTSVPFAGALTLTSTTNRQIQFGLKLLW
jgi:hypothetical protein